jgi:uncharacterized membrane protein YdbT with pleckstrin-like domain
LLPGTNSGTHYTAGSLDPGAHMEVLEKKNISRRAEIRIIITIITIIIIIIIIIFFFFFFVVVFFVIIIIIIFSSSSNKNICT